MPIATLIAAESIVGDDIDAAADRLRDAGLSVSGWDWIDEGRAADIMAGGTVPAIRAALAPLEERLDIVVQPGGHRRKMLLVSDMDSTMITVECIDELADYAGLKAEISAVTERAMRGELDFVEALRGRVKLLEGLEASAIDRCRAERVRIMPGARELVPTMRGWGAHCLLVSGGFHHFADPVAAEIGFDRTVANRLAVERGQLTGEVTGAIVDSAVKARLLADSAADLGLDNAQTLAVGDGANDIPMIEAAGLGIAYHAKPKAAAAAGAAIRHNDLTTLLYAQGVPRAEWVRD
ncbi:phosphoserine phosphatase SerB [Novosphingopyxis sp.]|uniref:phosphoserine phosphatase SerB n=1 Tax=Novosphingopyxis sp. TaxID=2709690 RepID=UPI003B5C3D21